MKWCDAFWQQQMYGDGDSSFGYSVGSNVVENGKGIMDLGEFLNGATGEFVDGENMTQFVSQESDLFKAPISADPSINSCSPNEDLNFMEEQIALMGLNLQDDIMLYSCDGNQGLTSSMIQSSPIPSDIAAPANLSEQHLTNFSPGLTNTVGDILNIKSFCVFESHSLRSGPIGTNESVIGPVLTLSTEGNLPFGNSSAPIAISGKNSSVFSAEMRKNLEDFKEAESLFEPMNIDSSTSHPELHSVGDLVVGDSSLISEAMESSLDALNTLWNAETVSSCQRPAFPSRPMKIDSFSGNPPLGFKENNAVGISSSSISMPMQSSSDVSIGMTNRVELLGAKAAPASPILQFPPAMTREIDSIHQPISVSQENVAIGNSYSSVATYLQNSPKIQRRWSTFDLLQLTASPHVPDTFQSSPSPPLNYPMMKVEPKPQFLDFQGSSTTPSSSMRRVYSTGDIKSSQGSEDPDFRIGQYTREERKLVVNKYKKKRSRRDFNKKIKYACRKSLADNQPRCQGRFAPKTSDEGRASAKPNALVEKDLDEVVSRFLNAN